MFMVNVHGIHDWYDEKSSDGWHGKRTGLMCTTWREAVNWRHACAVNVVLKSSLRSVVCTRVVCAGIQALGCPSNPYATKAESVRCHYAVQKFPCAK